MNTKKYNTVEGMGKETETDFNSIRMFPETISWFPEKMRPLFLTTAGGRYRSGKTPNSGFERLTGPEPHGQQAKAIKFNKGLNNKIRFSFTVRDSYWVSYNRVLRRLVYKTQIALMFRFSFWIPGLEFFEHMLLIAIHFCDTSAILCSL